MEELYREGKVRAIGVSNFHPDRVMDLMVHNQVVPAVNQVETHPFNHQIETQAFLAENKVQIESWGPSPRRKERIQEKFQIFDFELAPEDMEAIKALDTGKSLFFDHRDPAKVKWLGSRKLEL